MVFGMDTGLYVKFSALMFLEYAIWGAWYPVLSARLRDPLSFGRKQVNWIYATLPIGCLVTPLIVGQMADRWIGGELILAGAHLLGALLLFIVAWKKSFPSVFVLMLLYSLCYAATLPLVNALMFAQMEPRPVRLGSSAYIFMWAPVGWAAAGNGLRPWRRKFSSAEQGRDSLVLTAVLSVITAVVCGSGLIPSVRPTRSQGAAVTSVLGLLKYPGFLTFIVASVVVVAVMLFYLRGRDRFLQNRGITVNWFPTDQAVMAFSALLFLTPLVTHAGYEVTVSVGIAGWLILCAVCAWAKRRLVLLISGGLHGLACVCFIIGGQMIAAKVAPEGALASAQGLIFTAQYGFGLLLGTFVSWAILDRIPADGNVRWTRTWMIAATIMLACLVAFGVSVSTWRVI